MEGGGDIKIKLCSGQRVDKKELNKRDECGGKHGKLLAGLTKSGAKKSHRGRGLFKMVFGVDRMDL